MFASIRLVAVLVAALLISLRSIKVLPWRTLPLFLLIDCVAPNGPFPKVAPPARVLAEAVVFYMVWNLSGLMVSKFDIYPAVFDKNCEFWLSLKLAWYLVLAPASVDVWVWANPWSRASLRALNLPSVSIFVANSRFYCWRIKFLLWKVAEAMLSLICCFVWVMSCMVKSWLAALPLFLILFPYSFVFFIDFILCSAIVTSPPFGLVLSILIDLCWVLFINYGNLFGPTIPSSMLWSKVAVLNIPWNCPFIFALICSWGIFPSPTPW